MKTAFIKTIFASAFLSLSFLAHAEEPRENEEKEAAWSHESEAAVAVTGGNTDTQNYRISQDTAYRWWRNTLSTKGFYNYGESQGTKNLNAWLIGGRYERDLNDRTAVYLGDSLEGDEFKGYDYRFSADLGGKRYLWKSGLDRYVFLELGYRYYLEQRVASSTRERNVDGHIIRSYVESGFPLTKSVWFKIWAEFLPDLSNDDNLAINFEPSLSVMLSEIFSFRVAYRGEFDGEPAVEGAKDYDYLVTNSLVAKF